MQPQNSSTDRPTPGRGGDDDDVVDFLDLNASGSWSGDDAAAVPAAANPVHDEAQRLAGTSCPVRSGGGSFNESREPVAVGPPVVVNSRQQLLMDDREKSGSSFMLQGSEIEATSSPTKKPACNRGFEAPRAAVTPGQTGGGPGLDRSRRQSLLQELERMARRNTEKEENEMRMMEELNILR